MQALLRAAGDTSCNNSELKCARMHQHELTSVASGRVIAQALTCPHKGQRHGPKTGWVMKLGTQSLFGRRNLSLLSMRHFSIKCGSGKKGVPGK